MIWRTTLITPGDQPDRMEKALASGADAAIWDLEDGVNPEDKTEARATVGQLLDEVDESDRPRLGIGVRINQFGDGGRDDVRTLLEEAENDPRWIVMGKADTAEAVEELATRLDEHGSDAEILADIESAEGLLNSPAIASVPRVRALMFGEGDYRVSIDAIHEDDGTGVMYARQKLVAVAKAHDVDVMEPGHPEFEDPEPVRAKARESIELGFDGLGLIHPNQIRPVQEAFEPDDERTEWARDVIEAQRAADHTGAFRMGDKVVTRPTVKRAERIVEMARLADETE